MGAPAVSVLIATYNRSDVLHFAIESVRDQTFTDWELLVVGDGCTDDSAEVVARFADPRIRWHNLPENSGSQAIPNATGIAMTGGAYIAHIGHDDLWCPRHLEHLMQTARETDADFLHGLFVRIGAPGSGVYALTGIAGQDGTYFSGITSALSPTVICYKRALIDRLGTWRPHTEIELAPDQEFMERLFAAGVKRVVVDEITAIKFPAAWRKDSYKQRGAQEQRAMLAMMRQQPDFLYRMALRAAKWHASGMTGLHLPPPPRLQRRGEMIEHKRRLRGLEPRPLPAPTLRDELDYLRRLIDRRVPVWKAGIARLLPPALREQVFRLKRRLFG